ncbi:hypothetical protein ABZV34_37635, partial [Streptomyces sp. NPDC005195]|uniref:hypothetical protein n=1 Tax=Streptomyces sp. NPDC005195 TaxID=3154561 RepID=UPI0033BBF0B2
MTCGARWRPWGGATPEQAERQAGPHTTARHRGEGHARLRPALEDAAVGRHRRLDRPGRRAPPDTVDALIRRRSAGPR